jgi:3-oxoacyl-[acyl-carrier-protein] synthase-3
MSGPDVFNFTTEVIPKFTQEVLQRNNIEKENINQFVYHQANAFMLNFLRRRSKIEKESFYIDLKETGNTVSNTIPIALKKYSDSKELITPENIIIVGFGVGLSWCGGLIKIKNKL